MSLTKEQITDVKGRGFLLNRGTECFSGRVVSVGGKYTAHDMKILSACAEEYGNGTVVFTSRLSAEIPGIPYDRIPDAKAFLEANGMYFGGTGAKVRPITACKGSTCVFGSIDTHQIAEALHETFYIGYRAARLPHKFKIGVGGCPNSCMKPSLNDVGIEGCRAAGEARVRVYVGGTWGKTQRMGTLLPGTFAPEEVVTVVEKILLWYKENAYAKERLGACVDRLGTDALCAAMTGDALLERKAEILSAEIKVRG